MAYFIRQLKLPVPKRRVRFKKSSESPGYFAFVQNQHPHLVESMGSLRNYRNLVIFYLVDVFSRSSEGSLKSQNVSESAPGDGAGRIGNNPKLLGEMSPSGIHRQLFKREVCSQ